jgi:hypothetical protein|tara:strand:- start:408 stop:758 length:351 start_codon:yes stop_codon:yes gene_type:complete
MTDEQAPASCPVCTKKETQQLRDALHECKTSGRVKDQAIEKLNKRVFILTMIAIGIAAIFGKEALDAVTEWIRSVGEFKNAAGDLTQARSIPSPGAVPLLAAAAIVSRKTRRRTDR